ncbi:ubl carboxyl-terminal hydrolase 18 isoform X1 [Oryzias latipes]|uniref:ubl carboxyl-terminal hydrolase 18 isoform X1 n=1 Tax=Oryzias latipes TaxID=8090 RepID=UPI0009D97CA4|nr:ubl carboxyl-terminal hydrolase 18 isoform X1 [Oryzias latipes]
MSYGIWRIFPTLWNTQLRMRGLANYHLSCCVNTLLQTFSATWELLELLERLEPAVVRSDSRSIPLELKKVLTAMRGDLTQSAPHRDFLHCLDRYCIRLDTQHDADEVFLSILNLMQQQIDDRHLALEIQDLYKISVETHLQCLQCNSIKTLESYQLSLPLHIKEDHNTLEDCMTSFFEHQELRGINCCSCAHCGTRTPFKQTFMVSQGVKLRSLPRILCIHLKRFRNTRGLLQKLHSRVTFPEHLDMAQILTEAFSTDFAQSDCKFSLYAVVVHYGTAMFGHYTAYVRDRRSGSWYHADDSCVQPVSWENVQMTYGGHSRETAYMLMYRRDLMKEEQKPKFSG